MINHSQRLFRGAAIIFIVSMLISGLGYLIRIILARNLSTTEFGLFFAIYNFVLLIGWAKGLGFSSALQKFIPELRIKDDNVAIKSLLIFCLVYTILSSVIVFLFFYFFPGEIINNYFKSNIAHTLFLILLLFIAVDDISKLISSYFLSVHQHFIFSIRDLLSRAVIIGLLLFNFSTDIFAVTLFYLIGSLFSLLVNCLLWLYYFSFFSYKYVFSRKQITDFVSFSFPLMIKDFFGTLLARVDTILLVYFRPLTEVAIYNVVFPTGDMLLQFSRPLGRILVPLSSELCALEKKKELALLVRMTYKYLFILLVFGGIFLFFFASVLLNVLFGFEYSSGFIGLQLLVPGFIASGLSIITMGVLVGLGKVKEIAKVTISVNLLNVVLNVIMIPIFGIWSMGYVGAIISTVFCFVFSFICLSIYLHRELGSTLPLRDFFKTLLSGFLSLISSYVIAKLINFSLFKIVAILILVLFGSYLLGLFLLKMISKKELKLIWSIIFSNKKDNSD